MDDTIRFLYSSRSAYIRGRCRSEIRMESEQWRRREWTKGKSEQSELRAVLVTAVGGGWVSITQTHQGTEKIATAATEESQCSSWSACEQGAVNRGQHSHARARACRFSVSESYQDQKL